MTLEELKAQGLAPEWMDLPGYETISKGYLQPEETPKGMYQRVAKAAASYSTNPAYWEKKYFDIMWANWLCPASPVLSNMGTSRGLPISCNSIHVGDSVDSIYMKLHEFAMLSKYGAGVGIYMGDVRGTNAKVSGNGVSSGIIPWIKNYDSATVSVKQGKTRGAASAIYVPIDHPDIEEFIDLRRQTGDINRRSQNVNHGVCISDKWMQEMISGDNHKREIWKKVLKTRFETGEPYLFFTDSVNRQNPECYTANNLSVKTSNICTEIFLHTDEQHSFVCCLSSMNLVRWDEWKDTDAIETSIRFLDAVLEEYIVRSGYDVELIPKGVYKKDTEMVKGLENSIRSAIKGRALGLGVLGYHTLLQTKGYAFDSFDSMMLNNQVFKTLREKAEVATKQLAEELGEPEWCKGHGRRNTHLLAIAPTASNSTISGGHSPGIEPIPANMYSQKSAKGTFIRKNPQLVKLLQEKNKDIPEVWKSINENAGSVQQLKFLNPEEKAIFLTAREINQFALIKQAEQRQRYIDQGQSLNLFFASNTSAQYLHDVHVAAWKGGMLKSLYYLRSEGVLKGDLASRSKEECAACEA
jgi:ribonucleoside-diphosphate reductase alpha chain